MLATVKDYVAQGFVTVDTAIRQQTAVKKVRMIQIANRETLEIVLQSSHQNAKKQIELIQWMIEHAGETISAKQLMEQSGIQQLF